MAYFYFTCEVKALLDLALLGINHRPTAAAVNLLKWKLELCHSHAKEVQDIHEIFLTSFRALAPIANMMLLDSRRTRRSSG